MVAVVVTAFVIVAVVIVVAVGAVAVPWIYINLVKQDAPEALTLDSAV